MASFVIEGGHRLSGEIHPQGAKNEVLQIICATLLTAEEVTVDNIPDILDVNNLIQLMREMGVTVSKKGIDSYSFKAENVDLAYLESDEFLKKCSSLRGSVMLIGPMVARFGKALISKPGGDKIGRRRLDTHFLGIQNLGADFRYDEGRGIYEITADRLQGNYMLLDEASVKWGSKVIRVVVKNIFPPREIQDAMEKQMKAVRERREQILRAEGEKKSAILIAEGNKQSVILEAEAEKASQILRAEAKKEATIKEAEGQAQAILAVQQANADGIRALNESMPTNQVITLKSLEAFTKAADGKATKIIIPSEIQGIAGLTSSIVEVAKSTEAAAISKQ